MGDPFICRAACDIEKNLFQRIAAVPFKQAGRIIPVVEDDFVDMEFGSGAVKVTPAHDPNDFDIGKRHGLEEINIMDEDGALNSNGGKYAGLDRYEARKKVLQDLESGGFLTSTSDHISSVGMCSRCDTAVEPRISTQWFVSMKSLAEPAIEAVRDGRVKIIPKKWIIYIYLLNLLQAQLNSEEFWAEFLKSTELWRRKR